MRRLHLLLAAAAAAGIAAGLGALGAWDGVDRVLLDARIAVRDRVPDVSAVRVVVAHEDDCAVEAIGDWPWDRRVHAQVVECLRGAGASAVGLDFLFDGTGRSAEGDALLAETARKHGGIAVGLAFEMHGPRGGDTGSFRDVERHSLPAPPGSRFPLAARLLAPVEELTRDVAAVAFLNAPVDGDGKSRHAWLFVEYQGRLFASLPLALYLIHQGKTLADVRLEEDGSLQLPRADGSAVHVPLDDEGRLLFDPAPMAAFPVHAFAGVFDLWEGGGPDALATYQGRPVLAGSVMIGSSDVRASARDAQVHGVFLQASILANLLEGRFLREGGAAVHVLLLGLFSLIGAVLGRALRGAWQALAAVVLLALAAGGGIALAGAADFVPPLAAPLAGGLLAWGLVGTAAAVAEARHRRRVESAFQGFLPEPILEQILADKDESWLRPQRREGSLLLARVTRSDTGRLAPEEDAALLNDLFAVAIEQVRAAGGTLVVLDLTHLTAVFGAPVELEGHARAAARTAFALREALARRNTEWIDRLGTPFEVALALHAGVLSVGPLGTPEDRAYSVFGPEVSAAQALLARASADQILASDRFLALVASDVEAAMIDQSKDGRSVYELREPPASPA